MESERRNEGRKTTLRNQKQKYKLDQQQALAEIGLRAVQITRLDDLVKETISHVCSVLHVPIGLVLEFMVNEDALCLAAVKGFAPAFEGEKIVQEELNSQAGTTLISGETLVVENFATDTRFEIPNYLTQQNIVSGLTAQIPGRDKPYGVLAVYSQVKRSFSQEEIHFLSATANILASAVERKQAEDESRFSHNQLSVILESAADGITVQDESGRLIYANDAAARSLGYESKEALLSATTEEIIDRFELFGEDDQPISAGQLPGRLVLKGAAQAEAVVGFKIKATGKKRWSSIKASPVLSPDGKRMLALNIFQDITDLKRSERTHRFIAEAGKLFSASLDYQTILQSVSDMAAASFADWCTIGLLQENRIVTVAVSHIDSTKVKLVRDMEEKYPPGIDDEDSAVARVIRTGKPLYFPNISPEMIDQSPRDEEYKQFLKALGIHSAIVLPLIARGRTLGALTLIWADSGRTYSPRDVEMADELCQRAAIAIDNALLYREVQQVNNQLEQRIQQRTGQLQSLVAKLRSEINERKKAQDDLIQNEAMLEGLIEAAPDATLLVNPDGMIVRVNVQVETLFGYKRDEIIGQPVDILFPLRYRFLHKNYRLKLLSNPAFRQEGGGIELYARRSDGSEFPVDVVLSPVQTRDGLQTISAIRDVSYRKQIEAELAEVQGRLMNSLEAERLMLAQEIHDGAIQDLYGATYGLKGLEDLLAGQGVRSDEVDEYMRSSREAIQLAIDTLRSICGELRPPALAPFGLEKAITGHIDYVRANHPELSVHLDLTPDRQTLPEQMRMALYRIYQHAVSNVIRHAQAKNLWITFALQPEQIFLEIRDDGVGFKLPSRWIELAREGHLGLIGSAERAEAVGARLNLTSEPGGGTQIQVIIPQGQPLEPEVVMTRWLLHGK